METQKEIEARYKQQHNKLTKSYYSGKSGLTKDEFDAQHAKIWGDMEAELIANGFREAPKPPEPTRDLIQEIDDLKARVGKIEGRT